MCCSPIIWAGFRCENSPRTEANTRPRPTIGMDGIESIFGRNNPIRIARGKATPRERLDLTNLKHRCNVIIGYSFLGSCGLRQDSTIQVEAVLARILVSKTRTRHQSRRRPAIKASRNYTDEKIVF